MDIQEDLSRDRVHAIFGASFWQNPANHALVRCARAGHDRSHSLPRLRQAFTNSPTLLAEPEIVEKIVQVGLWFAGEPDVDGLLFDSLNGSSDVQRRNFARVMHAHPGFVPGAPLDTPDYRRILCDHVKSVLVLQAAWRSDNRVTSGIDAVRKRFPADSSVQALAGWLIASHSDETVDGKRPGPRPVLVR